MSEEVQHSLNRPLINVDCHLAHIKYTTEASHLLTCLTAVRARVATQIQAEWNGTLSRPNYRIRALGVCRWDGQYRKFLPRLSTVEKIPRCRVVPPVHHHRPMELEELPTLYVLLLSPTAGLREDRCPL